MWKFLHKYILIIILKKIKFEVVKFFDVLNF